MAENTHSSGCNHESYLCPVGCANMLNSLDIKIPEAFVCPITLDLMITPVVDSYGFSYERKAYINHLHESHKCPMTSEPYRVILNPPPINWSLKAGINNWWHTILQAQQLADQTDPPPPLSNTPPLRPRRPRGPNARFMDMASPDTPTPTLTLFNPNTEN